MATELTTQTEQKSVGGQSYALVTLIGQIDENNLGALGEAVNPLIGGEARYLVCDLAGLEFINSKVIGYLAETHGKLTEADQVMLFANANQNILDIIELVGLTQIVPTFERLEQAEIAIKDGEV